MDGFLFETVERPPLCWLQQCLRPPHTPHPGTRAGACGLHTHAPDVHRYGDSIGRILLEFTLYAVLVHRDHVPGQLLSDVCSHSRALFIGSAFHSVRRAANCLWLQFDQKAHATFSQIFALQKDVMTKRTGSLMTRCATLVRLVPAVRRLSGGHRAQRRTFECPEGADN